MFTVECLDNYADNDGESCSSSKLNGYDTDDDTGVKVYGCYDECNTLERDWSNGHCCNDYHGNFNVDKSTCTNCLCLDPAFTTIPGTYLHQEQATSNFKL